MNSTNQSSPKWNTIKKKKNHKEDDLIIFFKKIKKELDNEFRFLDKENNLSENKNDKDDKNNKNNKKDKNLDVKYTNIFSLLVEDSE